MQEEVRSKKDLGKPICSGRSSDLYLWKDDILLKLFHENVAQEMIENERINSEEAFAKGVSKVRCYGGAHTGEQSGILIQKFEGKTMIEILGSKPTILFQAAGIMADMQIRLHNTHTDKMRSYKEMILHALDSKPLQFLTEEERKTAIVRVHELPDGNAILHLDYHPDNIMTDGTNYTIIDWMTAARGTPAADVAATRFLLSECEMIPGLSPILARILEIARKKICNKYYKLYKEKTGMTDAEVEKWRLPFMIVRLGIWNIDSEVDMLQSKIKEELRQA